MELKDPEGNSVVAISEYICGGVRTIIYKYGDGEYRGFGSGGEFMTWGCKSLEEVKRQIGGVLVGRYSQNN